MTTNNFAPAPSVIVVLFGATGDLARRMVMPALVELHQRRLLPDRWRLIGCATDRWDDEKFRARLEDSLLGSGAGLPEDWPEVSRLQPAAVLPRPPHETGPAHPLGDAAAAGIRCSWTAAPRFTPTTSSRHLRSRARGAVHDPTDRPPTAAPRPPCG